MRISIPDDYQDAVRGLTCFAKLAGHDVTVFHDTASTLAALAARLRDADALVLIRERTAISAALLDQLPQLKLISQTGKGIAHVDLAACTRHGIVVSVGTGSPFAPAELTWGLVLAASRHLPAEAARLQAGLWQGSLGRCLRGRTLGVWGYGKIGSLVAGYGRAFGMKVLVWGREGSFTRARADAYSVATSREEFLECADILTLHLRLTEDTHHLVTGADLARMKTDALLVNTSRAELIEAGALATALQRGRPGFAAVDVYEQEPVFQANHPLLALPNALCTPHLGYVEQDSYENYFGQAFDQILAFAQGHPINVANPEVLPKTTE